MQCRLRIKQYQLLLRPWPQISMSFPCRLDGLPITRCEVDATTWITTPRPHIGLTRWRAKDCPLAGTESIRQSTERTMSIILHVKHNMSIHVHHITICWDNHQDSKYPQQDNHFFKQQSLNYCHLQQAQILWWRHLPVFTHNSR